MSIDIRSFNQILGGMLRKIIANTPLTDVNAGSVLLTLLEAAASADFENNAAILNVLEILNIDAVKNNDLDLRAADYGLTRRPAIKASGRISIYNTNIVKRSTSLYVIKPAPIAGQTTIYVNNTDGWAPTGSLYIGRGTQNFEGPIAYSSITVYPTHSEITLSSALQKDHLMSDSVIDSQGEPDRVIAAGTVVKIPSNSQNPEIQYVTIRDAIIPAGEDRVENIEVLAVIPGSMGNARINTITEFDAIPFAGAAVSNTSAFSNGKDVESDVDLRNRIKSYAITLARGTASSIISAVIGLFDPNDSKQIVSAVITEPIKQGEPSIMYIDDGTGFQPSYEGQSVDVLLDDSDGKEDFLQLANYPLPRPQVVNSNTGPFNIAEGSFFRVSVDGVEETVFFSASQFINPAVATMAEVITAINDSAETFKVRFTDNSNFMLVYPTAWDAETIQVSPIQSTDNPALYANAVLKFPTNEFSYIALYKNSERLKEKAKPAAVTTTTYASWNVTTASNIIIAVDNTPPQDRTFDLSDFQGATSFANLSLEDWVKVFNDKFAGLTAEATPAQTMRIVSNKIGSDSKIVVSGGTLLNKWFSGLSVESVGQSAQFELNRQTGNLKLLVDIKPGDVITAGSADTKGFVTSTATTSTYNVSADSAGRPSVVIAVLDSSFCNQKAISLPIGGTLTISNPSGITMRLMSPTISAFQALLPGDFIYITPKTTAWVSDENTGLFKIKSKGGHTSVGVDTYIDVDNVDVVAETAVISDSIDIKGFSTDGYPQIWRGTYLVNPGSATISQLADSFNNNIANIKATVFKSNSVKLTSTTERGGSIALPVVVGSVSDVFSETQTANFGNPPHIASLQSQKSLTSFFRPSAVNTTNVWLDRAVYTDLRGTITNNSIPDPSPFSGSYSEVIESSAFSTITGVDNPPDSLYSDTSYNDYILFTKGNNKGQIRSVAAYSDSEEASTQQGLARTELDHTTTDEVQIVKAIELSADDSIVVVMDNDASTKTVDIKMSRTGIVNSGSGGSTYLPNRTEFSANDYDNEPGIDFSDTAVWGTTTNKTDFSDYKLWFKAHNWYSADGVNGTIGKMIVRAANFGPNGEKIRFAIDYPVMPDLDPTTTFVNAPSFSTLTYLFGSGPAKPIALGGGDTITVSANTGDYYDYTFSSGNFSSVAVGDILSIRQGSGVSPANSGQFRINAISGNVLTVYNPNASLSVPGSPEIVSVTTVADVLGTPTSYDIVTSGDTFSSLQQCWFVIYDTAGSVAVWYDIGNTGALPPAHGCDRDIKVSIVPENASAVSVAFYTAQTIAADPAFNVTYPPATNTLTITNKQNGILPNGFDSTGGPTGFGVSTNTGTDNVSINRQYFVIHDENGSVAVWYDVDNQGTLEPFHGCDRGIRVPGVVSGDSAANVAAATAAAIHADPAFNASSVGDVITITNAVDGNMPSPSAGTTSFTVSTTADGVGPLSEVINNPSLISIFPLTGNDVATICKTLNETQIIEGAAVGDDSLLIEKATREEDYAYTGNSSALAFGHDPTDSTKNSYITLYDSENWVKSFSNINPNFVTKKQFLLEGVAPSVYEMHTAPNAGTADLGEMFKLIPTTVENIYHHMTQKALSQLPIVAEIDISNDRKNVQITSKNLGSDGAIEVIGGNANTSKAYIFGESEVVADSSGEYVSMKVSAYPDTFTSGDMVRLENDVGVERLSRLDSNDTIDVVPFSSQAFEYTYNPKNITVSSSTEFTITDVSAAYGRPSGFVWRWKNDGTATLATVKAGDLLFAFGPSIPYGQGNLARLGGDGRIAGLPIIAVNASADYFDVINPYGEAVSVATAVGVGNTVQICPTPAIQWHLNHAANTKIASITRTANVVTVVCENAHMLKSGDSVQIKNSSNIADGVYSSLTIISANEFSFASVGSNFSEIGSNATCIKASISPTRYKLEKLDINGLTRISVHDGQSPRFADCGVAVDDYVVLSGETFTSNNSGTYRVLGVDNDSLLIINTLASDNVNTVIPLNGTGLYATWTANSNIVTGIAGAFKDIKVGDWIKKVDDSDDMYCQVLSMNAAAASATTVTLGKPYPGNSSTAPGVAYDMQNGYYSGVILQDIDDIKVFEGDAALAGDQLMVQNIVDTNWFSMANIGTFDVIAVGSDPTSNKPFIRVNNDGGEAQSNVAISVAVDGFYLTESLANKFYTIRQIYNAVIDDTNKERRSLYLSPASRSYKFSAANNTSVNHMGKLGYSTELNAGIDGYLYYTGLLQRAQRTVDGYEPDIDTFPGRRGVGSAIEILPPLNRRISISIDVTTKDGTNLSDISNNIKSTIINYVDGLGVGQDVILSEIIAAVMDIRGVAAVTFTNPVPSTERIFIASNEKATITPDFIGVA